MACEWVALAAVSTRDTEGSGSRFSRQRIVLQEVEGGESVVVFWQAAVQTGGCGVVGPGQGSSTWSTEALRCFHLWRAACDVSRVGGGLICSLQRGLISGEMLQVNSACREGRSVPGFF